jgi:glycosyltransferase involved in cell wall biosynthesis
MHTFWNILLGLVALLWVMQALRAGLGVPTLPHLRDAAPLPDAECPSISVIFAARDEEEKMPRALESMLAQDYPHYEVVAVNDRSSDATGRIIAEAATRNSHLTPVHIEELPPGWLGKPHALQRGFEKSSGEWLLFTDGDVKFAPDLARRAMRVVKEKGWDHLSLMGTMEMDGFWEKVAVMYFGLAFVLGVEPWNASNPKSKKFMGGGLFQLVRRAAYEASGEHKRLAMEVIDDMKLGKIVKEAGFRSGAGVAMEYISLRWHAGLRNVIRGTTKNFFAAVNFSLGMVCGLVAMVLAISVLPFAALFFTTGWAWLFAAVSVVIAVGTESAAATFFQMNPIYGLTQPLGALIYCWMILRSTFITLSKGGVEWRGTFYRLEELRKGIV